MSYWTDESELDVRKEHWNSWKRPPARVRKVNNYMSAAVVTLSAFVVMVNFGI